MNPWDLIPWAGAIAVSLLIVMIPLGLFIGIIQLFRGLK